MIDSLNEYVGARGEVIRDYDCQKETAKSELFFYKTEDPFDYDSGVTIFEGPHEKHIDNILEGATTKGMDSEFEKFRRFKNTISKYCNSISEERYSELKNLSEYYNKLCQFYKAVDNTRKNLRNFLEGILKGETLHKSIYFHSILSYYNKYCRPFLAVSQTNDSIASIPPNDLFLENFYMLPEKDVRKAFIKKSISESFDPFKRALSYCLVEFLTDTKNRKLIKICNWCGNYFISSKDDKRRKYCSICSPKCKLSKEKKTEFQRINRERKRNLEVDNIRKAQIKRFLKGGFTEKEAEQQWETYKKENKL